MWVQLISSPLDLFGPVAMPARYCVICIAGEKVVPIPQEGVIGRSRMVDGAVMFGRGKSQCGVLIELSLDYVAKYSSLEALPKFRNAIWWVLMCGTARNIFINSFAGRLLRRPTTLHLRLGRSSRK